MSHLMYIIYFLNLCAKSSRLEVNPKKKHENVEPQKSGAIPLYVTVMIAANVM